MSTVERTCAIPKLKILPGSVFVVVSGETSAMQCELPVKTYYSVFDRVECISEAFEAE